MPTFYNFRENPYFYSFDDIFVPKDVFSTGGVWTWGTNINQALGIGGGSGLRSTPVTIFTGGFSWYNWRTISTGAQHIAAIKDDGTLWIWGDNSTMQLGINTVGDRANPVTTFAGGTNWKQVSCGRGNTAAIKTDGTLWVWGNNTFGDLGTNDLTTRSTPVTTFAGGTNWKEVSVGSWFMTAIKSDGTLWTWGINSSCNLGVNDATNRSTPVTTFAGGTNWKTTSAGNDSAGAIKTDGTLWVWGNNYGCGVDDNTAGNFKSTPVTTFAGGTDWKQISCSGILASALALKTDGTLWSWGTGRTAGNNNPFGSNRTPVTTFAGGTDWKQVSCGWYYCGSAIKTDGTLWTWGLNTDGQLGNDSGASTSTDNFPTPVTTFRGGNDWKQISMGYNVTSGITYVDSYL